MEQLGVLLALITLLCWALGDVVSKLLITREEKWKVILLTYAFGTALLAIFAALTGQIGTLLNWGLIYIVVLALINLFGTSNFYKAVHEKGITLTSPIVNSWAVITVLLGIMFYGETVGLLQWAALLLIICGIALVSVQKGEKIRLDKGVLYAILSMIAWGIFFFILKIPAEIYGPLMLTLAISGFTLLFCVPVAAIKKVNLANTKWVVVLLALANAILNLVGYIAYNTAVTISPVSFVASIAAAVPALVALFGLFIFREKISLMQGAGIALAILGILVLTI